MPTKAPSSSNGPAAERMRCYRKRQTNSGVRSHSVTRNRSRRPYSYGLSSKTTSALMPMRFGPRLRSFNVKSGFTVTCNVR